MTGHIPESFIEELISRSDIVEIIGTYVSLRRQGTNYTALCPFHSEKTPSFTVSQEKQFFHCFGCGAHGTILKFLMEYEGIHFVEACESLADRLGIGMPTENDPNRQLKTAHYHEIYNLLGRATRFYQTQLKKQAEGKEAVEYLKARGLTGQTAKFFAIGYAPSNWDSLIQELKRESESSESKLQATLIKNLVTAGLVIQKEKGGYYDRFRNRIIFPIRDRRGRVIGFGGRIINKGTPKYLNSPETIVFNKGQEVYGLYEARLKNRNVNSLIVVEGYLDVICLSQFGIENVVATLGTAITEKHLELLFQQVSELYFCFDGDNAGKAAAKRAMLCSLPYMKEGRRVKFIFLPNGEDPDSFVRRQGKAQFLELLRQATSLSDYLFESLATTLDLEQVEGRAELVSRARPLIARLPKGILQQMMYERLAELSGYQPFNNKRTSNNEKYKQNASYKQHNSNNQPRNNYPQNSLYNMRFKANRSSGQLPLPPSPAWRAIAMLLNNRTLLSLITIPHGLNAVDIPGTALFCAIIDILHKEPGISNEALDERLPADCSHYFKSIDLNIIADNMQEGSMEAEFIGAITRLKERALEQSLEVLLGKAKTNALTSQEKNQLKNLILEKDKIEKK